MTLMREAKRLHAFGFAIHFLRTKSKIPVESGWTTGPRASWPDLERKYRNGFNLGVRLGRPSHFSDRTYLAAIDCDVKSKNPKHLAEMEKTLRRFLPAISAPGVVLSGRGNGSAHHYVRTKEPANPRRLAQSAEKVQVLMPSVSPSNFEIKTLTPEEIKKGLRLRAAWEISLMGEGQQIALPPSIHPDTEKPYVWAKGLEDWKKLPLFTDTGLKADPVTEPINTFTPSESELSDFKLPEELVERIVTGEGVEDRSAALFGVTIALLREGLSENEVLTVLTDRENYLGQAAFDHAKTDKRSRAAYWLQKYTMPRAKAEIDIAKAFDDECIELPKLSKEAAIEQVKDLTGGRHWREEIERGKDGGPPKQSLKNVDLILCNAVSKELFQWNEFNLRASYGFKSPWNPKRPGDAIQDDDTVQIKSWLSRCFRFEPSVRLIDEAIRLIMRRNSYHPVRDYLNNLVWDGVQRIDNWLKTYLNASGPEPYLSEVSRKVLCAAVARVLRPGIKFDHMLILEGKQGVGKSSAARILASEEWFVDSLPDVKDKDARLNLLGKWIVEIPELASLSRADAETHKAFFSAQTDTARQAYARRAEDFPRQCIFIGTTNQQDYLKDRTGNRRYWPVAVGRCRFKDLVRDRDQLFAEARMVWENFDEPLYLEGKAKAQAEAVQESRVGEDRITLLSEEVEDFLNNNPKLVKKGFKISELCRGLSVNEKDSSGVQIIGRILTKMGYEKHHTMGGNIWSRRDLKF